MKYLLEAVQGEWAVTALGPVGIVNFLGDCKIISDTTGYNVVRGKEWGWFKIEEQSDGSLILNYDDKRNARFLRNVRDTINVDGDGWLGTLRLGGRKMFDFRLLRK